MNVGEAYVRGLVLVVGASFVLSALVTCICVKMALDLASGVGTQSGDPTTLLVGGLGAAAVIGVSGRSVWRARASIGWRVYGVVIALVVIAGTIGGGIAGARISDEHVDYVRAQASATCDAFVRVHPDRANGCEARAIPCRVEVRAHPPVVARGVVPGDSPGQSDEPRDPIEHAVWACLAR